MKYFIFECNNCEVGPVYMVDATNIVLCGSCFNYGNSQELTSQQIEELDLPAYPSMEIGD
jgi:hypothetical protein